MLLFFDGVDGRPCQIPVESLKFQLFLGFCSVYVHRRRSAEIGAKKRSLVTTNEYRPCSGANTGHAHDGSTAAGATQRRPQPTGVDPIRLSLCRPPSERFPSSVRKRRSWRQNAMPGLLQLPNTAPQSANAMRDCTVSGLHREALARAGEVMPVYVVISAYVLHRQTDGRAAKSNARPLVGPSQQHRASATLKK